MPRTIGSVDKFKSWKKNQSANDSIGMVTFDCNHSDELQHKVTDDRLVRDETMLARGAEAAGSTKLGSYWEISEVHGNESKEELTSHSLKETYSESQIVPRSFLADHYQAKKP